MRMDDRAVCYRCESQCHDLVGFDGKCEMSLQCCFCGAITKLFGSPPEKKRTASESGRYTLKYGRHAGKKIEEVAAMKRGVEYLELLAKDSEKMRPIIEDYLNTRSAVSEAAEHS